MPKRENEPAGTDFANFFSFGTRALKLVPPANWLFVGNNNIPKGWHVLHGRHAQSVAPDEAWIDFEGDPTATTLPIPRLAKVAGVVAVNGAAMNDLRSRHPMGLDAVALRFEDAVVVGGLRRGMRFDESIEAVSGRQLVGARILHDGIRVLPGLLIGSVGILGDESLGFMPAIEAQRYSRGPIDQIEDMIPVA